MAAIPSEELLFADLVVAQKLCTRAQADECLSVLGRLIDSGVQPLPRLGELLLRKGYLSSRQLEASMTMRPPSARREGTAVREAPLPDDVAQASQDPANVHGKYVKVSRLGAGGMGEVWRAWDRELGRAVALKFLKSDQPDELARFMREAQTAAALNHPNIASVYEVGEVRGKPFIAMQLVPGQTLSTFPRNDARRAIELIRDAALAIQYAHEQGVIHRDLKPQNLMVDRARVYVMDFGLAKPTQLESSLSVSGAILGTPAYMPPEQARGEPVSASSDVYSLGATLYEMLADRPPFQAKDVYALLKKVVEEDPRPLRRIKPSIDGDLETIVHKCLEKDPARRYASARELADELHRWLQGEAIRAHPPSAFYLARKFVSRRKALFAIGLAGVAAVALSLGVVVPRWLHERSLKELGLIRTQLAVIREAYRQPFEKPASIRGRLERELERAGAFIAEHPRLPHGYLVRAQGAFMGGDLAGAERDLREAVRLDPEFSPAWTLLARVLFDRYRSRIHNPSLPLAEAMRLHEPLLREAVKSLERGWTRDLEQAGIARWGLVPTRDDEVNRRLGEALALYYIDGRKEDAARKLKKAHEEVPSGEICCWLSTWATDGKDMTDWAETAVAIAPHEPQGHQRIGDLWWVLKRADEAVKSYTKALECNPRFVAAYIHRSASRSLLKHHDAALDDATRAVEIDPEDALAHLARGIALRHKGRLKEALQEYDRALALNPANANALCNRSGVLWRLGERERADQDLDTALRLNPDYAGVYISRGYHRWQRGDLAGAREDFDRAVELDPRSEEALRNRSELRANAGDPEGALADLNRLIETNPRSSTGYVNRSKYLREKGDEAAAFRDNEKAIELDPLCAMAFANRSAMLLATDLAKAREAANRAVELDPEMAHGYLARANGRVHGKEWDAAEADFRRALELDPRMESAYASRAAARGMRGDPAGAREDATRAIEINPRSVRAYMNRAAARKDLGDAAGSLADYVKASELDPRNADAHRRSASGHLDKGDLEAALKAVDRAIEVGPGSALAWSLRGNIRGRMGGADAAIEDLTKAVELDPNLATAWANRGLAYSAKGNTARAIEDYEKALSLAPPGSALRKTIESRLEALRRSSKP